MLTEGTRVVEIVVERGGYRLAGRNRDGVVRRFELIAPDVTGRHVAHEAIILPVLGLADGRPLCCSLNDGESICGGGGGGCGGQSRMKKPYGCSTQPKGLCKFQWKEVY